MSNQGLSFGVKIQMIAWALFMPVFLVFSILAFLPDKKAALVEELEVQKLRTTPVGYLKMPSADEGQVAAVAVVAPPPKETYDTVCAACHATGLLESPKFGDKAAWDKRLADAGGFDGMVALAIKGKGSMPPKGGATLNDEDFAKVVAYLAGQPVKEDSTAAAPAQTDAEAAPQVPATEPSGDSVPAEATEESTQ